MRVKSGVESAAGPGEAEPPPLCAVGPLRHNAATPARFLTRYASYARAPTKGPPGRAALLLAPGSRARHVSRAATAR